MQAKPRRTRRGAALSRALRAVAEDEARALGLAVCDHGIPFHERVYATIRQTCEATGLGHDTIYRLIKSGRLKSLTIGKRRLIVISSLLQLGSVDDLPRYRAEKPAADSGFAL